MSESKYSCVYRLMGGGGGRRREEEEERGKEGEGEHYYFSGFVFVFRVFVVFFCRRSVKKV